MNSYFDGFGHLVVNIEVKQKYTLKEKHFEI